MFDLERDYRSARKLRVEEEAARFQALIDTDLAAAIAALRQARLRGDLAAMLAGGALLFALGRMPVEEKAYYANALVMEGQHLRAVEVWTEVVRDLPGQAVLEYSLAEALIAAGLLSSAREPAQRALDLDPGFLRAANMLRRLRWLPKKEAETRDWPTLRLLVEGYAAVGAADAARERLGEIAATPPAGEPTAEDARRLVASGLDLGRPKTVKQLMGAIRGGPADDVAATLRIRMATQLGLGAAAAKEAAALTPPLPEDAALPAEAVPPRRRLRYHAAEAFAADRRTGEAIRQLGALVLADRRDFSALTALQRCSGDAVLQNLDWAWAPPRPPKIFNLLPFYNERVLLDLRRAEMGDWVDHFVVVEATHTFTGKPKPLNFAEMRGGFDAEQWLNVTVDQFPDWADTAWARDFHQRDSAVRALVGRLRPDDIVLITDADEIVDRRALDGFWPHLANLRMATSKHFLNYCAAPGTRHANRRSGAICRGEHLARFGSTYIRTGLSAARKSWESTPNAGWHFTSLGDASVVVQKLAAYAHQEEGKSEQRDLSYMRERLSGVRAGQDEPGWERQPVDERFPRYVRDNQKFLAPLLLDA